ncbi:MAG: flavodoxin [Methanomicrobiales archaeon]|nr:flavodoxin [Methanomicrobiales archaeon]
MRSIVVYHSDTGHTKYAAEYIAKRTSADLIRVRPSFPYNEITRRIFGVRRALFGSRDRVEPESIDVSGYDCIVVGSPVWAGSPTPVINGAIAAMEGCEGKEAVAFVTCCMAAGRAPGLLRWELESQGARLRGTFALCGHRYMDPAYLDRIVAMVTNPSRGRIPIE